MVEKTNIAYVEPHSVMIKEKLYLFFNQHKYFYIGNLANKIPLLILQTHNTTYFKPLFYLHNSQNVV